MADQLNTNFDARERIWSSGLKPSPMYNFDCSIGRIIHNALRNYPKNICQICLSDGVTATNQDILNWSVRLAQHFKQRGLRHDDVICIVAKNSTYVTPTAVACLFNATPFHAVNPSLDVDTLTHVLSLTNSKIIFCDAGDYEKIKTASSKWKPEIITVTGKVEGISYVEDFFAPTPTEMFYQPQPLVSGGDQTVAILCSSGTTGKPKAVCLANHMIGSGTSLLLSSESVVYCGSGLDWITGLNTFVISVADGCTRIIPDKPYSPEYIVELVDKYKINAMFCAPRHVSGLVTCPQAIPEKLASLVIFGVGGGWIPEATLNQMQKLLTRGIVSIGYGTTEFSMASLALYDPNVGNTVGKLMPGFRLRIVDDNGKNLGHNEVGELYVHHGRSWGGYYGNPMESQRMQDSLGWFHSGDVGYFDANNNLYIVDRKKEVYKCLGMQYWAKDIEMIIAELPDVHEVSVVGLYDEKYGDAPTAMVVKRPGSSLSAEQIKQHVAKRVVVEFKQLHGGVHFADELPHNDVGKVIPRVVKEKLKLLR